MSTGDALRQWSDVFARTGGLSLLPRSVLTAPAATYALVVDGGVKRLAVVSSDAALLQRFPGTSVPAEVGGRVVTLRLCTRDGPLAGALRREIPFLVPRPIGLKRSAGCGDRLGVATPGHLRAFRRSSLSPVLAQQSMRENTRTGRSPQQVVDDAMWGVFQEGWQDGYGADADHLKTVDDIDRCAVAGYTMYTIDPSEHVDNSANEAAETDLRQKIAGLPWTDLDTTWDDTRDRFSRRVELGSFSFVATEEDLLRAAAKYGRAVAHTASMWRRAERALAERPFELEVSVDESETVTTLAEHVYIANELRRLGVRWVSLAPRYVGEFEKGVEYRGDLDEFERTFRGHFAVSQAFGPYKLSLHSGSDKFSIFPIADRVAGQFLHLKTAGTSYLEALRVAALIAPDLFREIVTFARGRYPTDRASYTVSGDAGRLPAVDGMASGDLPALLDDFDARQILHVTFGSVIQHPDLSAGLRAVLNRDEGLFTDLIEAHFVRHFRLFDEATPLPPAHV